MSEEISPMDEMEEYEIDVIELQDEEGLSHSFEVVDSIDLDGKRYFALIPYDENGLPPEEEEEAEMLIMRVGEENGEEFLDIVEDEDELANVGQIFLTHLEEMYNLDLAALEDTGEEE